MNYSHLIPHIPFPPHAGQPARIPARNIALVPMCLLPYRARWQALANTLPAGCVLVCLPACRDAGETRWADLVRSIQATGHDVFVIPLEHLLITGSGPDGAAQMPSDARGWPQREGSG